jgi:5,10-methylenetetrahydromethanopterin reductase
MRSPRIGVWFFPVAPVRDLVDGIVAAEAAGFDECWIADEGVSREPIVAFSAAALLTSRIRFGIGITSPAIRHPGAMASSVATLDELSGGRAMLGFGVGGGMSLDPFGLSVEKPVALIRDAIRIARGVMEGAAVDGYTPPGHASPPRKIPIYVGSKGEQINRMASRDADGVFLSGFDLARLDAPVAWARSVRPIDVALFASVQFNETVPHNPSALQGTPTEVAAGLLDLVQKYQPETIGLALIDGASIADMLTKATETLHLLRAQLT